MTSAPTTIDVPFLPEPTEMTIPPACHPEPVEGSQQIPRQARNDNTGRLPLDRAAKLAGRIVEALQPFCWKLEIAGSIRRRRPDCGDIDLVVIPTNHNALLARVRENCTIVTAGAINIIAKLQNGFQLDIFCAKPEEKTLLDTVPTNWGSLLVCRTGSKQFNIHLANTAAHRHLHWDPYHGVKRNGQVIASATEEDIFRALGMEWIKPEDRER